MISLSLSLKNTHTHTHTLTDSGLLVTVDLRHLDRLLTDHSNRELKNLVAIKA